MRAASKVAFRTFSHGATLLAGTGCCGWQMGDVDFRETLGLSSVIGRYNRRRLLGAL
jgi:hypothetical protein